MKNTILQSKSLNAYADAAGVFPGCIIGNSYSEGRSKGFTTQSPIDAAETAAFGTASAEEVSEIIPRAVDAFEAWRKIPAPVRGQLIRRIGEIARERKEELAQIITLEAGKITQEALGEVQEVIDMCEFAVGLSRQLHGLTIASERPEHRMMEQWHPIGPVAVITAFNFPMAVWAWNAMLSLVCGNTVIWKPSPQTPLCALACHKLLTDALSEFPEFPQDIAAVVQGDQETAVPLLDDRRVALVSATGSCRMGRVVAQRVAGRLGRYLLELGGNNAMIVTESADLSQALRAIVFSAVGTAGQRCTSLRRVIVHESKYDELLENLSKAYSSLKIGDPNNPETLIGPLINEQSFATMQRSMLAVSEQGGEIHFGGDRIKDGMPGGVYVQPAVATLPPDAAIAQEETFAPLLYLIRYKDLDEALRINNEAPQGLSSAIFTQNLQEAEYFLSPQGSDCGIANVNIGTSGAEIGGAFGGEKDTGGGRESGSDAWKNYMRRATNTVNYGSDIPLAQGVQFDI